MHGGEGGRCKKKSPPRHLPQPKWLLRSILRVHKLQPEGEMPWSRQYVGFLRGRRCLGTNMPLTNPDYFGFGLLWELVWLHLPTLFCNITTFKGSTCRVATETGAGALKSTLTMAFLSNYGNYFFNHIKFLVKSMWCTLLPHTNEDYFNLSALRFWLS